MTRGRPGAAIGLVPYHQSESVTLYLADCREVVAMLPDASVDLIVTDPPYFRVKAERWDRQWDTAAGFLAWMGDLADEWRRVLKPNGALYVFASPAMAWGVEGVIRERLNVLNSIRWVKDAGWHQKAEKEALRSFLSPWEAVIFAEQYGADSVALNDSGYAAQTYALHKRVYGPLGQRIAAVRERAGLSRLDVDRACAPSRKPTGLCYRWEEGACLPTLKQYTALLRLCGDSREDAALRQEYEALRRPFALHDRAEWSDIWRFQPVPAMYAKHPCAKPVALLEHIIAASSRPGALVLDCFLGSGATAVAARNLGRQCIGVDTSERYLGWAIGKLAQQRLPWEITA